MTDVFELIETNGLTLHGDIEHFAELVRANERDRAMRENAYVLAEREACALLVESRKTGANELMDTVRDMEAAAIRARGNT